MASLLGAWGSLDPVDLTIIWALSSSYWDDLEYQDCSLGQYTMLHHDRMRKLPHNELVPAWVPMVSDYIAAKVRIIFPFGWPWTWCSACSYLSSCFTWHSYFGSNSQVYCSNFCHVNHTLHQWLQLDHEPTPGKDATINEQYYCPIVWTRRDIHYGIDMGMMLRYSGPSHIWTSFIRT